MNRERVILLIYHGQGHFNACLKTAKILSRKYDVTFAGHIYFESFIQKVGFQFYPLTTVPFGLGFERWINLQERKNPMWWHILKDRWTNRLFFARRKSLEKMLDDLRPDFLIIDSWQSTDFVAAYSKLRELGVKTAMIQTMLSTIIDDTPPLTSSINPDETNAASELDRFRKEQFRQKLWNRMRFLGKDNAALVHDAAVHSKIPKTYISEHQAIFAPHFNLPEFILAPAEFEFTKRKPLHNQIYVGSMTDPLREEISDARIETILSNTTERLIYCTFGSTDLEEADNVNIFLSKLVRVIDDNQLTCILSTGSKKILEFINGKSNNIFAFSHVPQLKVLQHTSLFINHGGLNSIKEALELEVPMLVYPVKENTDNQGNAARVAYHGLGIKGDLLNDSTAEINEKVLELLSTPRYKSNLKKFNETAKRYTEESFLEKFIQIKKVE